LLSAFKLEDDDDFDDHDDDTKVVVEVVRRLVGGTKADTPANRVARTVKETVTLITEIDRECCGAVFTMHSVTDNKL